MSSPAEHSFLRLKSLLLLFAAASLIHFIHNAEFLAKYPGLPESWTRWGVYGAWLALSCIGLVGWLAVRAGYQSIGLLLISGYALGGMDSLGHYVVAPMSAHTLAMNVTILLEVNGGAIARSRAVVADRQIAHHPAACCRLAAVRSLHGRTVFQQLRALSIVSPTR